jgi:PAS domain S-box-containing protein
MYVRLRLYGMVTLLVTVVSFLLAYLLSKILQKTISMPILALADTAKIISANRDYSVRAVKSGNDELGSLTDSFNVMLQQIQDQNNSLQEFNQKLEQSEKLFRAMIEKDTDMKTLATPEGKVFYASPSITKILGYGNQEFITTPVFELIHPDDVPGFIESVSNIVQTPGNFFYRQHRLKHKNGTWIWCEGTITNMLHEPAVAALVSNFRDITERKQAEENIRRTLKEVSDYKYALDESSIVAITDQRGVIKYVNDNFCKISKYSRGELIGQDHRIINSGYHPKEFIRHLWVTIAKGKIWKGELKNKAKDGTIYWVDTTIIPFLNGEGKPYQYVAIRADITERKETEQALNESQQLLSAIIDNSTAVIYVKNLQGQYILVNRRFAELFHVRMDDIPGKTDYDIFPKEQADAFREMDMRTATAGHPLTEEELAPHDDGLHAYISVKSTLRHKNGKPYAIFGISTDITDLKKAQLEVQKLNEELEQKVIDRTAELQSANKELESFTYSVSHDLRSPLRIIDGYADILTTDYKDKLDEEGNRTLTIIKTNARRMGQLIDDLLNLSHTGRKELVVHLTDMDKLVKAVMDEQLSLTRNIVTVNIGKLEPAQCDSSLLRQVWINLISNAIKYSGKQERPEIQISSLRNKKEIVYSIQDNGVGFDMKYAEKLFGVFQRLHRVTEFEGTGIGLALVHRILVRHRGKIWAESEQGKGAIFYFSLPVVHEDLPG